MRFGSSPASIKTFPPRSVFGRYTILFAEALAANLENQPAGEDDQGKNEHDEAWRRPTNVMVVLAPPGFRRESALTEQGNHDM